MRDAVERLYRRVQLMVGIGRTTAPADDSGPVQKVQVRLSPDEVRDGSRVAGMFGFSSHAPVGSDVVMVFIGGDRSKGVVIGTLNGGARFRGQKGGETALYNAHGISLHLATEGLVVECGGMPVVFRGGTKARFEMPVESTGEITAMVDGDSVTVSQHRHANGPKPTPHT